VGAPRYTGGEPAARSVPRFERWELGARLYHWGNLSFLLLLVVSGIALFIPASLPSPGVSWLLVHEISAGLFIFGLIAHIVAAVWLSDLRSMWFARSDWRDFKSFARYYAGASHELPKAGKFDVWQKIYHTSLILLSTAAIATGVSLFLNAEVLTSFGHPWMRWQRLIHDCAATLFLLVILGHLYVRLAKLNWPKLRSMLSGTLTHAEFDAVHDWRRWQPPADDAPHLEKKAQHKREASVDRGATSHG
jgi:formate dehydrogenase gamma subunit